MRAPTHINWSKIFTVNCGGFFSSCRSWIYSSLPANKQMLAVSATYPESLANTLAKYMREPTFVKLNPTDPSLIGK